jgi:hypothetical protein
MRDADNRLRYVTGKDLWHDSRGQKTEAAIESLYPSSLTTPQAQPDHMWLTRAEWQSLVPAKPKAGEKVPLPAALADRLCRWHLNPLLVYGEANPLERKEVRAAELTLTVTKVDDARLCLRLDGFAKLGQAADANAKKSDTACVSSQWGYEPRLLGYLEFDRHKGVFRRFDVVALGDHFGRLGICDSAARPGLQPLGIAFELVTTGAPAERIPPGRTIPSRKYFER